MNSKCWVLFVTLSMATTAHAGAALTRLPGHVAGEVAAALDQAASIEKSLQPLTLTLVLRRDDEAGFRRLLEQLYDPASPQFRRFPTPLELSARFGPSPDTYRRLEAWLSSQGLPVIERSPDRMTLTVRGTTKNAQKAFSVRIAHGSGAIHASLDDPALPADLAPSVMAVNGLTHLQEARPLMEALDATWCSVIDGNIGLAACQAQHPGDEAACAAAHKAATDQCISNKKAERAANQAGSSGRAVGRAAVAGGGAGQVVAITAFDSFLDSDVADYFDLIGRPPAITTQLSRVQIDGGAPLGPEQAEVLLDISIVLSVAEEAQVVVYESPFTAGSFQRVFNRMIADGVDVISNSWGYCENQTTPADVLSIDAILQTAAAAGISVFSASGDSGSTCLNGAPSTIVVPSGAPHLTAVGGTRLLLTPGQLWAGERWWGADPGTQPTGEGGYGNSRHFPRPAYQLGLNPAAMRSIPDVSANADPLSGVSICQASGGGCPTGKLYGGTSAAAPLWAAYAATLNAAGGSNLGWLNPQLYPRFAESAFHSPAELQSSFQRVGLGTPNLDELHRSLRGIALGPVSATRSTIEVAFFDSVAPAEGQSESQVVVRLRDANGHTVPGKTVQLNANPNTSVIITPASGVSNVANGAVEFSVRNLVAGTVTFTALDVSDNLPITGSANVHFLVPSATAGSLVTDLTTVPANGTAAATLTVTLQDVLGRPSPGKLIQIDQGSSRAIVSGPNPPVTNAAGQIQFQARSRIDQAVSFRAIDVSDGDLPVPGNVNVSFTNATGTSCLPPPPVPQPGLSVSPFITGVVAENFFYSGVNLVDCPGASNPLFDTQGETLVFGFRNGEVFRFGPTGGVATSPLATLGPTLSFPTSGLDGRLYGVRLATGSGATSGAILELDPQTGAVLRTLASNQTCAGGLATDPLSGDLFFTNTCFGGVQNNSLYRLTDPAGTDPGRPTAVLVYANLPRPANGVVSFSPDGTLYVSTGYRDAVPQVARVGATNGPQPAPVNVLAGISSYYWVRVGRVHPDGSARSLLVTPDGDLAEADLTTTPPTLTPMVSDVSTGTIGPDGCIYAGGHDTVYRIAPSSGACSFAASNPQPTLTLAPTVFTPNPTQGSTRTLTATLRNRTAPPGTRVTFQVNGINPRIAHIPLDAQGSADFEIQGIVAGDDRIVARLLIGDDGFISNPARITWVPGPHFTAVNINGLPAVSTVAAPIILRATLLDFGGGAPVRVAGQLLRFQLGAEQCSDTTDTEGEASCAISIANMGRYPLTASFAGTPTLLPADASTFVDVLVDRLFHGGFEDLPAP